MTSLDQLTSYYRLLRQHGLNDSHSGNASIRIANDMWITPTGACADTLTTADLVFCPGDTPSPSSASQDNVLHRAIYKQRNDVNAVLHGHPVHAIALTMNGADFVPEDFEGKIYFGAVPVLDVDYERYFDLSVDAISRALVDNDIVIARGHGVYSCANTLEQAYKWINSLEISARINWISQLNNSRP